MDLPPLKTIGILKAGGVTHLHHANSVITACQFLRRGALLSRGTAERYKLYQTPQDSDDDDQYLGLWYDVFSDSVDIHQRASRVNVYGPVLLVLDIEKIEASYIGRLWVTKTNPLYWRKTSAERWFKSTDELRKEFSYGDFGQMLVFRHVGGELPIRNALVEIILDDPKLESGGIDLWSMAYGALQLAMTEGRMNVPIKKRECGEGCRCEKQYLADWPRTKRMFFPQIHGMDAS